MKLWYIYIMSNKHQGVIYVGVTDNLNELRNIIKNLS
jgi:putative endonuclease